MSINANKRWDKQNTNTYPNVGNQWAMNQGAAKTPAGYGAYLMPSAGVPVSPSAVYGGTYLVPGITPAVNPTTANANGTPVDYVQGVMTASGSVNNKIVTPLSAGAESTDTGIDTGTETKTEPTYAEKMKHAAYDKANVDYLAAVTDAENRYKMQTNPYGATAERMAASGLQNTGYAGYLTDRAYATKVDEVLAAKAQKSAAERAAETEYAAFLQSEAANKASVYGESGDFVGSANALLQSGSISPDEASSMILNGYKAQINDNTIDIDRVDTEYANGNIDDATYNSIKKYWNDNTPVDEFYFSNENGEYLTAAAAEIMYNNASKWLDPEKKAKLDEVYRKQYVPISGDGLKIRDIWWGKDGEDGNSIMITDKDYMTYFIQYAGEADPHVNNVADGLEDGTVFVLGDKVYIKQGGKVFATKKETVTNAVGFSSLNDLKKTISKGRYTFTGSNMDKVNSTLNWVEPVVTAGVVLGSARTGSVMPGVIAAGATGFAGKMRRNTAKKLKEKFG